MAKFATILKDNCVVRFFKKIYKFPKENISSVILGLTGTAAALATVIWLFRGGASSRPLASRTECIWGPT